MTITALPAVPSRSDPPAVFVAKANAFIAALPQFGAELNAMGTAYNLATTTTSSSSVLIGTGSKTFTVPAGLGFVIGMSLTIASTASPTNRMYGQVTSYSGTTLIVNVTVIGGSGTLAAWTIALAAEILGATLGANTFTGHQTMTSGDAFNESISTLASSATPDIWSAQSNVINYTGTVTATGFAAAPQAGVRRTLILAGAASFTAGANMLIDGGASFTGAAGDVVEVIAVTTTQFRLKIMRADGGAVVPDSKIISINATVAANALTITLNPTNIDFRSSTLGSGVISTRTVASAISLVISSGSTLGTINAIQSRIAVLAIDNAGTVELAAVNIAGGVNLDETGLISTTAEGGAGAADSISTIYSTTARTNVPYRIVGFVESTQATAGTWATAPSFIQGAGGNSLLHIGKICNSAVIATTSGTSFDFTGIPSWAKRITVLPNGISTNGTSNLLIQAGSGSIQTTGYSSSSGYITTSGAARQTATNGFLQAVMTAVSTVSGSSIISLLSGNTYINSGVLENTGGTTVNMSSGIVTLAGVLDRIRITTVNGTDVFDGGSVMVLWE